MTVGIHKMMVAVWYKREKKNLELDKSDQNDKIKCKCPLSHITKKFVVLKTNRHFFLINKASRDHTAQLHNVSQGLLDVFVGLIQFLSFDK